jgi:hypothetical protein
MTILEISRPIARLKRYCTEAAQETARDAVQVWLRSPLYRFLFQVPSQIFGGRGITKTGTFEHEVDEQVLIKFSSGMGQFIEHVRFCIVITSAHVADTIHSTIVQFRLMR